MSREIDWPHILKEVFSKENLIAILVIGFFPPILGAISVLGGLESPHNENWGLTQVLTGWVYSYIVTTTLFIGSAFIINILNQIMPWKGNINRRVVLEVLLVLVYTSSAQIVILWTLEETPLLFIQGPLEFKDYLRSIIFSNTITIIVVAIIEGVYFFRNWRESLVAAERLQKEHAESQLANLRSQLDPHFMFNSLNVLTGLIRQNPKKAESFVEDFARVYRHMLEVNNRMVVPLREEVNFTRQYLRLQQIRFEEGLQVNWELDDPEHDTYIPPLSLQEVISNAIKHNAISKHNPLHLSISSHGDQISVSNTINLRKGNTSSTGLGLKNIQERYRLLQKQPPTFHQENGHYIANLPLLKLES